MVVVLSVLNVQASEDKGNKVKLTMAYATPDLKERYEGQIALDVVVQDQGGILPEDLALAIVIAMKEQGVPTSEAEVTLV